MFEMLRKAPRAGLDSAIQILIIIITFKIVGDLRI